MPSARSLLDVVIQNEEGQDQEGASLYVYEPDGTTLLAQVMRDAPTGGSVLSNPLTADLDGRAVAYVDQAQRVTIKRAVGAAGVVATFEPDPGDLMTLHDAQTATGAKTNLPLVTPTVTEPTFVGTSTYPASGLVINAISQPMDQLVFGGVADPRAGTRMQLTEGTFAAPADTDDELLNITRYWKHSADSSTTNEIAGTMLTFQIPDDPVGDGVANIGLGMTFNGLWVRIHSFGTTDHPIIGQRVDAVANGAANGWGMIIAATSQNGKGNQGIEIDLVNAHSPISALAPSNGINPAEVPDNFSVGLNIGGLGAGSGQNHHAALFIQAADPEGPFWDGIRFALGTIAPGGSAINIGDMVAGSGSFPLLLPNNIYIRARDPTYVGANVNLLKLNASAIAEFGVGLTVNGVLTTTGTAYIGDTSNADITNGLTINQGGTNNQILALKKPAVAHGVTTVAETDTYGAFMAESDAGGGLRTWGLADTGSVGARTISIAPTDDTTKTAASVAGVVLSAFKSAGTSVTSVDTNGNLAVIQNGGVTRFIFDADGDSHQDVGTAWTNFDAHDDLTLVAALAANVSRQDDPIRASFGQFLFEQRAQLEALRLVTFNDDGHHFVNMSKLTMLLVGALRQLGARLDQAEAHLLALGAG